MEDVWKQLAPWLSAVADFLSVIAFGITVWVLVETKSIKQSFALRGRSPALRRALAEQAKSLTNQLTNWPQVHKEALSSFATTKALLENLLGKLPAAEKTACAQLIKKLKGRKSSVFGSVAMLNYTDKEIWIIFNELQGLIAGLEQLEKDLLWR